MTVLNETDVSFEWMEENLPVYGDGLNVRDWLYVGDHCSAIDTVLRKGVPGEVYNIGGINEWKNIDIVRLLLKLLDKPESLIRFVKDRPGHDRRYSLNVAKVRALGWERVAGEMLLPALQIG